MTETDVKLGRHLLGYKIHYSMTCNVNYQCATSLAFAILVLNYCLFISKISMRMSRPSVCCYLQRSIFGSGKWVPSSLHSYLLDKDETDSRRQFQSLLIPAYALLPDCPEELQCMPCSSKWINCQIVKVSVETWSIGDQWFQGRGNVRD